MEMNAFITGADRGLGFALTDGLLKRGWQVYAGQYLPDWPDLSRLAGQFPGKLHLIPLDVGSMDSVCAAAQAVTAATDHLDVLINNAGVVSQTSSRSIREAQDYGEMHRLYDINTLGPLRVVEAFLPLMDRGTMRRLCFVSSEAGSIERSKRTNMYGYTMSKAALNMGVKILFNHLRPEGYTFRLYHPGWLKSYMGGKKNMNATLEPEESVASALPLFLDPAENEDRLVLMDYKGEEWPW
ncbi:MAG: SDR family NAD(P)-dependent oxidoreductase [Chloroflexi bacterium]|nr:MAG: SDR family NAD(P)-dependent oxidoreductase [Chloroflexota bacterium]